MFVEMRALHKSERWEVDDLLSGKKPVGCKWVFGILYKTNSSIERCKMRLVAKEKTQIFSNGYQFAPMTKMNSIRILLSLSANFFRNLFLFDIKNSFFSWEVRGGSVYGFSTRKSNKKRVCAN